MNYSFNKNEGDEMYQIRKTQDESKTTEEVFSSNMSVQRGAISLSSLSLLGIIQAL
jgi:hypothetical protein